MYRCDVTEPFTAQIYGRVYCAWCGEQVGTDHEPLGFAFTVHAWEACALILDWLRPTGITRIDDWLYDWLDMTWCADPGPERPTGETLAEWAFAEFNL
jgi:hypothetical protein